MSTLNYDKKTQIETPPRWALDVPEAEYHAASASGSHLSSGMLKEFRLCPAHYRDIVMGTAEKRDSDAFRFGRAVHKLVLEGENAFRAAFAVGGPVNGKTGRTFAAGARAFAEWLRENGLERHAVLTPEEAAAMRRMRDAALRHGEIARLFAAGWPERTVRADWLGVACQARLDWLRSDGVIVDLKTVEDLSRFEGDARRFGYLHQFAFYRDVVRAAGGGETEMIVVALEKKPPWRAGVWRFSAETLEPCARQNRDALALLIRCREENRWPTGYEATRQFPPFGVPPLWLN